MSEWVCSLQVVVNIKMCMLETEIWSPYTVSQVSQFNFNVPAKCMYDTSKTNREFK